MCVSIVACLGPLPMIRVELFVLPRTVAIIFAYDCLRGLLGRSTEFSPIIGGNSAGLGAVCLLHDLSAS